MSLRKTKQISNFVSFLLIIVLVFSMNSVAFAENTTKAASTDNKLRITSVEIPSSGAFQSIYRDSVYKGVAANGEDPNKYYTTNRDFNLKDPRIFNLEFDVSLDDPILKSYGDFPYDYMYDVELYYGGVPIGDWGDGNNLRGSTDILTLVDGSRNITTKDSNTRTVSFSLRVDSPWTSSSANHDNNVPYGGYYAGDHQNFGNGETADNRDWWQAGPTEKGMGTYKLEARVKGEVAASTDVHIGPYDEMNSWIEMNEYAQSLVKAVSGQEIAIPELDKKPTGTVAKGYVAIDEDGNFIEGNAQDNIWVEVSILGYGLTDNYKDENKAFNNYSRFNPIWNIAVAKDKNTVTTHLEETVPLMNDDPQNLINKYKDKAPEDIDMVNVYYQNNVHSDKVTGTDTEIKLITDLIDGGKAGKVIQYKTFTGADMNYRYRLPTSGFGTGSTHQVKGLYSGDFMDSASRTETSFNTAEALEKLIFVTNLTSNPDGKAAMRMSNSYGIDNNSDANYATQPESIALTKDLCKWDPLIMIEWNGYEDQMVIEPCTAPHNPTVDYDLIQNNMLKLSYSAGRAVTANTGYANFQVPWDHLSNGERDDSSGTNGPKLSMLLGTYGYTVSVPHSNTDSFEAGNVINYAMINELLKGTTQFYGSNRLNEALYDKGGSIKDSHEVDNKYTSMRKSSIMNKLEAKRRGAENIDSMDADKYFIDEKTEGKAVVTGRPRAVDANGKTLSYYPDYIVIPMDEENQYNDAEAIKGINRMMELGINVSVTTGDVTYNGKKIPKGAYVFDMKQGRRNLIYEIMSKGYDATDFSNIDSDIYCNLPDVRGFDSIQIYGRGLYDDKLSQVKDKIGKSANIKGTADDYVVFKSQSTDAVRFVNLLLSGKSSGGSTAEKGDVWMLRKDVDGIGNASDYVIKAEDLNKINNLKDDANLGLNGCHIEGKYISNLPKDASKLVEPIIQFNTERTAYSGGPLWWALDDYLGFGSMADYNGSSTLREGANVVVSNDWTPNASIIDKVKKQKLGLVLIRNASALNDTNFGIAAPSETSFSDVALRGQYNVDDSLFTANYAKTSTIYARGSGFSSVPEGSKVLFKTLESGNDAFLGGYQNVNGDKSQFGDKALIFSTILTGGGIEGKPVQALAIGQNMHYSAHYQKLLPMLATGIYAGAAGILDDQNNPEISDMTMDGSKFKVTANEPDSGYIESGIESLEIEQWDGSKYVQIAKQNNGECTFDADTNVDHKFRITATDYAGNKMKKIVFYTADDGGLANYDGNEAILTFDSAGGTSYDNRIYEVRSVIGALPEPEKNGYIFGGWYTDDTFNTEVTAETIITSNMTIVAKWATLPPMYYSITATANEGGTITASGSYKEGSSATFTYSPNKGYKVSKLYVNGNLTAFEAKGGTYTFNNINSHNTINVLFEKDTVVLGEAANPKKAAPKNFKAKAQVKKAKLTWKKTTGVTKYQIAYKQKGKSKWSYKTVSYKKATLTIKKLKAKKKYQFKIRSYKTTGGKKVYSKWSGVKTVKIKS